VKVKAGQESASLLDALSYLYRYSREKSAEHAFAGPGRILHHFPWEHRLKMGSIVSSLRSKDEESLPCCQANGRAVRIIHHRETLYPCAFVTPLDKRCGVHLEAGCHHAEQTLPCLFPIDKTAEGRSSNPPHVTIRFIQDRRSSQDRRNPVPCTASMDWIPTILEQLMLSPLAYLYACTWLLAHMRAALILISKARLENPSSLVEIHS
jgi:hypothetical protein